jgi:hypothetical protein
MRPLAGLLLKLMIKADDVATTNLELASLIPNQQYESGLNN